MFFVQTFPIERVAAYTEEYFLFDFMSPIGGGS